MWRSKSSKISLNFFTICHICAFHKINIQKYIHKNQWLYPKDLSLSLSISFLIMSSMACWEMKWPSHSFPRRYYQYYNSILLNPLVY